jgi:monovalent cation:proton antiporter-2 (CPA2) family protein
MNSFLEQALTFITAALILVPLFQRLGFGSVLGYLIAGLLIGPYGLNLIGKPETIAHVSELGVVMLLFLIGIELQPGKLWNMRRHLLGLGGLQVLVCSLVFMLIAGAAGLPWLSAAVVGFAFSLSSTAFAVQTLTERNQFNTEFGRASFAVLLMQDLMAIPALAVIPALGASTSAQGMTWASVGFGIVIIAALIVASRYLMRLLFRLIASTHSREIFMAVTFFIVFGVAALMQKVGLSAALGTFIAGVLLSESEYRHELETNLEPFKSLLMGLFFIAVGMSVRLDLISGQLGLVVALAVGYLLLKTLIIYSIGRAMKLGHESAKRMALSISQGGEFAFVIFAMAAQLALASSETIALLTAVITLSMALNPLISLAAEALSQRRQSKVEPVFDEIKDEAPEVIVAGFGRFGQIFGRILRAQNIAFVPIDHDPEQIELLRRFDNKVYYGDASRLDLLEAAGAAQAKYFVLAIDDVEASLDTARLVRQHFPHLKIFARARNRGHAFDLMALGVHDIKRETFDASAHFAGDLLEDMGVPREQADRIIARFKRHDELMLEEQFKVRNDAKVFVSVSKQATAQLAEVLREDALQSHIAK